jgi:hypothetical protein
MFVWNKYNLFFIWSKSEEHVLTQLHRTFLHKSYDEKPFQCFFDENLRTDNL